MKHIYKTKGTCSRTIEFEIDGDVVKNVEFIGGCAGNTAGIGKLVEGKKAEDVVKMLSGINCRGGTSCPDQLATAIREAI